MRNVTILRVAMPLAVMAVLVWAVPANAGGVLYETGFETVDGFTPGGTIDGVDGWTVYVAGDIATTETTNPISGSMSMWTPDTPDAGDRSRPTYWLTSPPTEGTIACTLKARLATNEPGPGEVNNHMYFYLGGVGTAAIALFGPDGKFYAYGSGAAVEEVLRDPEGNEITYEANTVYGVRIVADLDTNTYDVYIDSGSGYVLGADDWSHSVSRMDYLFFNIFDVVTTTDDVLIVDLVPGDADYDGDVDMDDFNTLSVNWTGDAPGSGKYWQDGDFDDDGDVDMDDFNALSVNWTGSGPGSSVPEPVTMVLMGIGGAGLLIRRRSRKK